MILTEQLALIARHQEEAPVDIVAIAEDMGLGVWMAHDWPDSLSGMIKPGKRGYVIYVNASHSRKRRRYTIAHELAHFMFHENLIGDGIVDDDQYRSRLNWASERVAANFAGEILMPVPLIACAIETGITDIARLAEVFDVSVNMMAIRLGIPY